MKRNSLGARASCPQKNYRTIGEPKLIFPLKDFTPGWHARGYLPHLDSDQLTQSITIRLFDSLPQSLLTKISEKIKLSSSTNIILERRKELEAWLDSGVGNCCLSDSRIASIVENALLYFEGRKYHLHAWVIMPNHVHFLFTILPSNSLKTIIFSLKSYTAQQANRLLTRTGAFWYPDYFDRYIRNAKHYERAVNYIENNPTKAGLCRDAKEWRFCSAWRRDNDR